MRRSMSGMAAWVLAASLAIAFFATRLGEAWGNQEREGKTGSAGASPSLDGASSSQGDAVPSPEEEREAQVVARFLEIVEKNPRRGTAIDRVYGHHVERGTLEEFVESYRRRAAEDESDGAAAMIVGLFESQRGNDAAAVAAFRDAEARLPESPLASFYLGESLVLVGRPDESAAAFERAIDRKPPRAELLEVFQALGRVYQRAQRHDEALAVWDRLEKLFPNDARVQEEIATTLAEEGRHGEALARFESLAKSVKDEYRQVSFQLDAAELKLSLNRTDEALQDFETLLDRLDPESWLHHDIRRRIEEVFLRNDDLAGLAAYYEAWVEKNPEDVDAIARLGRTLAAQGRLPESRPWFEKGVKLAPSNKSLRLTLIEQLVADDQLAEAATQYEALDKLDPNNPDTIRQWGRLLLRDESRPEPERKQAASAVWRRLLTARPNDALTASQVADLFRDAEAADEAIALYRKAIELAPDDPQYSEYLGEYLHSLKRSDEALAAWDRIAEGENRTAENLTRLAEVLGGFGYREQAIAAIREAIVLDPIDFDRQMAYAQLLYDGEKYDESLVQLNEAARLADSPEQRDAIQKSEIEIYQIAGKLPGQIEALSAELAAGTNVSAERWLRLALFLEADRRRQESLDAVNKALALDERSLGALATSARLNEAEGSLGAAADALRTLAAIDRRFRTEHLGNVAKLEVRLGRREQALAAGRDLIAAAPGNSEHYQFFADLCLQLGDVEQGLDSLRRAVRVNPADTDSLLALANALAANFRTDEAIELYWRVFDKSSDLDERLGTVSQLAEMYLRTNHLERLIERLGRIGREADQEREMRICMAQAFHAAGDYGSARGELERLLSDNTRDTQLLVQLSSLSETEGDLESAARFQAKVNELAPSEEGQTRLAELYVELGEIGQAQEIWTRLTEGRESERIFDAIDSLLGHDKHEHVLSITSRLIRENPHDWEALYREGVALAGLDRTSEAVERFEALGDIPLSDDEQSTQAKAAARSRAGRAAVSSLQSQSPFEQRFNSIYEVRYAAGLEARDYYGGMNTIWMPADFGRARIAGIAWRFAISGEQDGQDAFVDAFKARFDAADATSRDAWDLLFLQSIRVDGPAVYEAAKRLSRDGSPEAQWVYLSYLSNRPQDPAAAVAVADESGDKIKALPDDELAHMLACFEGLRSRRPDLLDGQIVPNVQAELKRAKRDDEAKRIFSAMVEAAEEPDAIVAAMQLAGQEGDVETMLALFDKLDSHIGRVTKNPLEEFNGAYWVGQALPKLAQAKAHGDVLKLVDRYLIASRRFDEALGAGRRRGAYSQYQGSMYVPVWTSGGQTGIQINYPMPNKYVNAGSVQVLRNAFDVYLQEDLLSDLHQHFRQAAEGATGTDALASRLAVSYLHWWAEEREESAAELASAIELAPPDEVDLRLDLAAMKQQLGAPEEALAILDAIEPRDHQTLQKREQTALGLAVITGDLARARTAAERLFGLRLDAETHVQLASQMHQQGMHEMAEAVLNRARQRAGNRSAALVSLMQQYQRQGDLEAAVQIAHQILRSGTQAQVGPNQWNETNEARNQAVQVLSLSGKLDSLIERAEGQLVRAPGSLRILRTLAEYHNAAGHQDKVIELYQRMAEVDPTDSQLRFEVARQLAAAGDTSAAIEHFVAAIDKEPMLLVNEYWEIQQTFQQADKLEDLMTIYDRIDLKALRQPYVAINLASNLLRDEATIEQGLALFRKAWDAYPNERPSLLNQLYDEAIWQRPEVYDLARLSLIPEPEAVKKNPWSGLDQIISWGGEGTVDGVAGRLLEAATAQNKLAELSRQVDQALAAAPEWTGGKALRAIIDARTGRLDQAKQTLEGLFADEKHPVPLMARWVIGQELSGYSALAELELAIYEQGAKEAEKDPNGIDFSYSPVKRLVGIYQRSGRLDEARDLVLKSVGKRDTNRFGYDPGYAAYQRVQLLSTAATELVTLGFPADAIRLQNEVLGDVALTGAAARYGGSYYVDQLKGSLSGALASLDEEALGRMLRDLTSPTESQPETSDANEPRPLLDLMLVVDPGALDTTRITSGFQRSIQAAAKSPEIVAQTQANLLELSKGRESDLSVPLAGVLLEFAKSEGGDRQGAVERLLAAVESAPLEMIPEGVRPNSRQRDAAARQLGLWLAAREAWKEDATRDAGDRLAARALEAARRQSDRVWALAMLREQGQMAFDSGDRDAAEKHWESMLDFVLSEPYRRKSTASASSDAPTIVTIDKFQLAAQIAALAAERGMTRLSLRAIRESLRNGPPVEATGQSGYGGGYYSGLGGGMGGGFFGQAWYQPGAMAAQQIGYDMGAVADVLSLLDQEWRKAGVPAEEVYQTLVEIIVPAARPSEIFLYEGALPIAAQTEAEANSGGRILARWCVAAGKVDDLRTLLEERRASPLAELPATVILVQLAVESNDAELANRELAAIAARLELDGLSTTSVIACHAAFCALGAPSTEAAAAAVLSRATANLEQHAETEPYDTLVMLLARRAFAAGEPDAAKALFDAYLAAAERRAIEYESEYRPTARRAALAVVARECLRADHFERALAALGEFVDLPVNLDYGDAPINDLLVSLARRLQIVPANERYEQLAAWALPVEGRQSVRDLVCFLPSDPPPSEFGPLAKPPVVGGFLPSTGSADVLSFGQLLIDAALEAERLDELNAAAEQAVAAEAQHAAAFRIRVLLAGGRGDELTSELSDVAADAGPPSIEPAEEQAEPFRWNDYLIGKACIAAIGNRADGEKILTRLLREAQAAQNHPLIARIRHDLAASHGRAADAIDSQAGASPAHWIAVDELPAAERTAGAVPSLWIAHEGHIAHLTGGGQDYLIFKYPLGGEFEFSVEGHDGPWGESHFGYGGIGIEPLRLQSHALVGPIGNRNEQSWSPLVSGGPFHRDTIQVEQNRLRFLVNGHVVHEDLAPAATSPWLILASSRERRTAFRNLRLSGSPTIPREVRLIDGDRLDGWASELYGEPVLARASTKNPDGKVVSLTDEIQEGYTWRVKDGVLRTKRADPDEVGVNGESHLAYLRPLLDGDRIEYEFLHQPGELGVYPALGRIAFLLEPEGVRLHWLTDQQGAGWTGLASDNAISIAAERRGASPLPLIDGDWNKVELALVAGAVKLSLNGTEIYERPLAQGDGRQFGFFHWVDRTGVQVRSVVLRGDWPESLPAELLADLAAPVEPISEAASLAARHALIGEEWLNQNSSAVHSAAELLSPDARYAFLADWVLPNERHPTFRLQGTYTPTNPLPESPFVRPPGAASDARRIEVAGCPLVPAVLLVQTAKELGQLDELEQRVDAAPAPSEADQRGKLALLGLIHLAQDRDNEVDSLVSQALALLKNLALEAPEYLRWPELVLATECLRRPRLRPAAMSLLDQMLFEQVNKNHVNPDWERRVRHARGLGEYLQLAGDAAVPFGSDPPLTQWSRVTHGRASSRGQGHPAPHWHVAGSEVRHFPGHSRDYLYFNVPLRGDFEVECELTSFGWRETQLAYAALAVGIRHSLNEYDLLQFGKPLPLGRLDPPLEPLGDWYRYKLSIADGTYTAFINDRPIHSQTLSPEPDPWLAIYSAGVCAGGVRNVRIAGGPSVPEALDLSSDPSLSSWLADAYDETLGGDSANWTKRGEEIVASSPVEPTVPRESLLQYHRPLLEDGEIEYEFFYEPDKSAVHPALDRLAFVLDPAGVKIHWLTDAGFERSGLSPDNESVEPECRRGDSVPLKPKEWNRLKLAVRGDVATVEVNGQPIYERQLEPTNQRIFGLFRYAGKTGSRIRNVTYRGQWPRELPPIAEQELAE